MYDIIGKGEHKSPQCHLRNTITRERWYTFKQNQLQRIQKQSN